MCVKFHLPGFIKCHILNFRDRKSVESPSCYNCVSAHVIEDEPVAHVKLGKLNVGANLIQAITSWSPNGTVVQIVIRRYVLYIKILTLDRLSAGIDQTLS